MKIITDEIERYLGMGINRVLSKEQRHDNDTSKCTLQLLLRNHPALDYADELLEMVKYINKNDVGWKRKTQALIEKIEGRKDEKA